MRAANAIRLGTTILLSIAWIGLGWSITTLVRGNERIAEAKSTATAEVPPIPPDGPLALPKSLDQLGLPLTAVRAAVPADNPQTPEKAALGEKLFFDGRLSVDDTVACSTCHDPARAFTDGREVSIGVKGHTGQRNAPTILNALFNSAQFWDGQAKTLEQQAGLPIINPSEMGQPSLEAAAAKIAGIPDYTKEFQRVFGRPPNPTDLMRAIASYERTQVSFDSPFDHFIAGDQHAISASAKRGWELFNTRRAALSATRYLKKSRTQRISWTAIFITSGSGSSSTTWPRRPARQKRKSIPATRLTLTGPQFSRICRCLDDSSSRRKTLILPPSRRRGGIADEFAVSATRNPGTGAATRHLPHQSVAARYGPRVWAKADSAQTVS